MADGTLKDKRILIFLRSLQMGGAERQAALLAAGLKHSHNADVHVRALENDDSGTGLLEYQGIPLRVYPPKWEGGPVRKITGLLSLVRDIRRLNPHVILPFTDYPNKICGAIWRLTGARSCIWNQRDEGREVTGKALEKLALKMTPVFVTNSLSGKRFLRETFNIDETRISIIHNGVQLAKPLKTVSQWRSELGLEETDFVAVMVANLQPFKDHETLIKAWHLVVKDSQGKGKPLLLLAGRFDSRYLFLKEMVSQLGLEESVRFLGEVKDIPGLLASVDLAVFSSKNEGCPNGVLEPMAAGLPVVATRITGIVEALGEDYPLLAPADDPRSMADLVNRFFTEKKLKEQVGKANAKRVKEHFSLGKMLQSYTQLLERVLQCRE
ncbi:MAG: glycosyltransferase [bacterium]|nr:glycosyltransferase [bacterium]